MGNGGRMNVDTWAVVLAAVVGPIAAVVITRRMDDRRMKKDRQRWLCATMMGLRGNHLEADHVRALNLIQLEFAGKSAVLQAWREFLAHVETMPASEAEALPWNVKYKALLDQLLVEIASVVQVPGRPIDFSRGGYYPRGWGAQQEARDEVSRFVLGLTRGEKSIPIYVAPPVPPVEPMAHAGNAAGTSSPSA